MSKVIAIPVESYAVRFVGDPEAAVETGDLQTHAGRFPTRAEALVAWRKIMWSLHTFEGSGPATRSEVIGALVFEDVFPGHGPVTHTEVRAFRREGRIAWSNNCIKWPPATIRIMSDFAWAYCWTEDGCQTSVDHQFPDAPGVVALDDAFIEWQRAFDLAPWEPAMPMLPGFDWPPFHAKGLELAGRLKLALGDRCQVIYEKPYEDPGHAIEENRLMVIEG